MMQAPLTIPFVSKSNKFPDLCSFQLDDNLYDNNLQFQCTAIGM